MAVDRVNYPVYPASGMTIKKVVRALKAKKKSIVVKDIDRFFKNL